MWGARQEEVDQLIDLALELIEAEPPSADVAQVLATAGRIDCLAGRSELSVERSEVALEMARAFPSSQTEAYALNTIAVCRHGLRDSGAIDDMTAAMKFAVGLGEPFHIVRAYINLSFLLRCDRRYEETISVAIEGLRSAADRGSRGVVSAMLVENASYAAAALGRWTQIDEFAEEVLLWRHGDLDAQAPTGLSAWACVMVKRGELDQARPLLEHDRRMNLRRSIGSTNGQIICGLLELGLLQDGGLPDPELIEADIEKLRAAYSIVDVMALALRACAEVAVAATYARDDVARAEAEGAADHWLTYVEDSDDPTGDLPTDLVALRVQCSAEHARAMGTNNAQQWAEVVQAWKQFERPWPTAYAQLRHGEALLMSRDGVAKNKATAKEVLSHAHAVASDLGAKPLLADIEALATRARINLRSETEDQAPAVVEAVPFDLTPRELEVLALVTEGYSNGRIGQELFISTKTASVHVSNILRKLNAANRIEAAAMATRLGITAELRTG